MSIRKMRRRRIETTSGCRFSICGLGLDAARTSRYAIQERRGTFGFAWLSGATLVAIVVFSVYAVERPPAFPDDPRSHAPVSAYARYSLSDVLAAVSR